MVQDLGVYGVQDSGFGVEGFGWSRHYDMRVSQNQGYHFNSER